MRGIRISIAGLMTLPVLFAVDLAVMRAVPSVMELSTRIGLVGSLLAANLLAVYLAIVITGLVQRGAISLSSVAFLIVGGTAVLILVHTAVLAPPFFFEYVELTAGPLQDLWLTQAQKTAIAQGHLLPPIYSLGMGRVNLIQVVLASAVLTPPVLVPALLAGWATRGYRLKLLKGPDAEGG